MFGLVLLRVPIAFALSMAVVPILILTPQVGPELLLQRMMIQFGSFVLLAIPFFIFAANIMTSAGLADRLVRFAKALVGWMPGGLAMVNVMVAILLGTVSASSNADVAAEGPIIIPAMVKQGYDVNFSVALTASSAVIGTIIPPSIMMVVWAGTLNISTGGLFLCGFIPGVFVGLSQMGLCLVMAYIRKYPTDKAFVPREVWDSGRECILSMFTPVIIIGGIMGGFFTPTEASVIAVMYSLLLGMLVYRTVTPKIFVERLAHTLKMASIILFCVGCAAIYAWVISYYHIPEFMVNALKNLTTSPTMMLFIIIGIFLLVGLFIDAVPAIIVFGPLLKPVAESVGIHPLHFAIVSVMSLAYGLITPPYGLCLLIACKVGNINCMQPMKEVLAFFASMMFPLIMVVFIPDIAFFIPKIFMPDLFR